MLNILSTIEKKKILTEYRVRLGIVVVFAVATLVLASLVLLAPSYFLAELKYNETAKELAVLESKQNSGIHEKDINVEIIDINKKIDFFLKKNTSATSSPLLVILNILNIKGSAIKIQGFTYDASDGQDRFVVVGNALDRESLSRFVETLKKDQTFTRVNLPIQSYVKSVNIDFSVVIERGVKNTKNKKI